MLILAMIQNQALVASKHYLAETESENLADNAVDDTLFPFNSDFITVNPFHVLLKMTSCYTGKIAFLSFQRFFAGVQHIVDP